MPMEGEKWTYELILENVPPFSWVSPGWRVSWQFLLMETIGIGIAAAYHLPARSIIFGSLGILMVIASSALADQIGPKIRSLRPPSANLERQLLDRYRRILFSPNRYDALLGLVIFVPTMLYLLLFGTSTLDYWLGSGFPSSILVFVFLLLWDICYRIGLGIWISTLAVWRSIRFLNASKQRAAAGYTPYRELSTVKQLDIRNLLWAMWPMTLIPALLSDPTLVLFVVGYATLASVASIASYLLIDRVPGYPSGILWILEEGSFAYVGTCTSRGEPHVTPVIFVFNGKFAYFVTSRVSAKIVNLRQNPAIAFLVDVRDPVNMINNRAVVMLGKAKIFSPVDFVLHLPTMLQLRTMFHKKYPPYMSKYRDERSALPPAWRTTMFLSRLLVQVSVEKTLYWKQARHITMQT